VRLLAWETLLPDIGPRPVTSQTLDMELSEGPFRQDRRLEKAGFYTRSRPGWVGAAGFSRRAAP
jgi:hypothetical protein